MTHMTTWYVNKGGVGKTNYTMHMGHFLSQQGKKVLLVDLDMQSNLTNSLQVRNYTYDASNIFKNVRPIKDIRVQVQDNLDLVAGSYVLEEIQTLILAKKEGLGKIQALESYFVDNYDALKEYDYIFFDLAPSYNLLAQNVIYLCESINVLVDPDDNALEGLGHLQGRITDLSRILYSAGVNKPLSINSITLNKIDNTRVSKDFVEYMHNSHPLREKVLQNDIPYSIEYKKSTMGAVKLPKRYREAYEAVIAEMQEKGLI